LLEQSAAAEFIWRKAGVAATVVLAAIGKGTLPPGVRAPIGSRFTNIHKSFRRLRRFLDTLELEEEVDYHQRKFLSDPKEVLKGAAVVDR